MAKTRNKYPLTTQTSKLFIVIRKNKMIPIALIKQYCDEYLEKYVFIEHKNDIEPVTGQVEGVHYHIWGKSFKRKTPLKTHLNDIVRFFRFDNEVGISVDKYDDEIKSIQYLLHKNNPEKTQHSFEELYYNFPKEELVNILACEYDEVISFDMVYSICLKAHNINEVIKEVGFKTFHKYRGTIRDMYEEIKRS